MCFLVAIGVWFAMRSAPKSRIPNKHGVSSCIFQLLPRSSDGPVQNYPTMPPQFMNTYSYPPEFIGCDSSEGIYNGSRILVSVPHGKNGGHSVSITGVGTGILTLTSSPEPNAQEVVYDMLVKGDNDSLDDISFDYPPSGSAPDSSTKFTMCTPSRLAPPTPTDADSCLYYEITMYIPRGVKSLSIVIDTPIQVRFSPQGHIQLDELYLSLTHRGDVVKVDAHESIRASNMTIETQNGFVNGAISVGNAAQVINLSGFTRLNVIPNASPNLANPTPAIFSTHTNTGKVSISYLWNAAYRKRRIDSYHMTASPSSFGDFDYSASGFDGLVLTDSAGYNLTDARTQKPKFYEVSSAEAEGIIWTRSAGNKKGLDRVYIQSGTGKVCIP